VKRLLKVLVPAVSIVAYFWAPVSYAQLKTITGGGYQYPNGTVCAGCTLTLQLVVDATVISTGHVAPKQIVLTLDANGNIPANSQIWGNDQLQPNGTTYRAFLTAPGGGQIWGPQYFSIAGTSPIALQQLIPVSNPAVYFSNPAVTNLNNTFSGNNTFIGNLTATAGQNRIGGYKLNTKIFVDNNKYTTPEGALAACPARPAGCLVEHTDFTSTSAGFTVGGSPAVNYFGQQFQLYPAARINTNAKINVLDSAVLTGAGFNSSLIFPGASFPASTPMVDVGDNINAINMQLSNFRINPNGISGSTCIRARGINDVSSIWNVSCQNYLTNGLTIDGKSVVTGGHVVGSSFFAGASGAGDAISVNNTNGYDLFLRNSTVNNAGVQSTGAGLHITGTSTVGSQHIDIGHHVEKHTDGILLEGNGSVTAIGLDCGNGTVNCAHFKSTATGSMVLLNTHNNANSNSNPVILNDATKTNLSSVNPPAPNGVIPFYSHLGSSGTFTEFWQDINGLHWNTSSSAFGISSTAQINAPRFVFNEVSAPSGSANNDVCYGDSTAHALKCSYNNGTFFNQSQTVASGTATMTTAAITTLTCGTSVTVAAAGVAPTDIIIANSNAAATTPNGFLTLNAWPTSGNVNFAYCNPTAASQTPAPETVNWRVLR